MQREDAKQQIIQKVIVTKQRVTLAKAYILKLSRNEEYESLSLVKKFITQQRHEKPEKIVFHPNVDLEACLNQASEYFIDSLAFAEALWALIYEGILFGSAPHQDLENDLAWTTVYEGGSGTTSGWTFDEFRMRVPQKVSFAPSSRIEDSEVLTDPNLFILESGIEGADAEVIEALEDCVSCFRHELYRAAITMLGKAVEGAWIEVGCVLARAVPGTEEFDKDEFRNRIISRYTSTASKIDEIMKLYADKTLAGHVIKQSGVSVAELKNIFVWSDIVREARNAIHFGTKPTIPNTYEKVAVLLLAGAKNLQSMYHIKKAAEELLVEAG